MGVEMSAKFAAITAGLLARKGEAQPWAQEAQKAPLMFRSEPVPRVVTPPPQVVPPQQASPPLPPPPGKERSCSLRLPAQDYERLGILAVKMGSTRQQLLKQALNELLAAKAQTLSCACLGACERNCG
jgi:hypothetical protein